jgi:hypothetical protein
MIKKFTPDFPNDKIALKTSNKNLIKIFWYFCPHQSLMNPQKNSNLVDVSNFSIFITAHQRIGKTVEYRLYKQRNHIADPMYVL